MKNKDKILLENIKKSFNDTLNILMIMFIGLMMAMIFYFAGRWITHVAGAEFPAWVNFTWIVLFFVYGCVFHDLVEPYIKSYHENHE